MEFWSYAILLLMSFPKKIFWVDYLRYRIESVNYEGFHRQLLFKSYRFYFMALAVDEEHVCATLPAKKKWMCLHKLNGDFKYYEDVDPRKTYGIAIFNNATQPQDKSNFCASTSCQHFCVNGDDRGICMCKEGHTLNQDGKTCSAKHGLLGKGILVSYKKQICIIDYRSIAQGIAVDFNCILTGLQGVEYLEVNAAEHVVLYYDSVNKRIKSYDIRSDISKTIQGSTGIVSGLSFDWNQKKLYWCESNTGIIGRVSLQNYITEVFYDSDKDVNDISVDPHNRTVFWVEGKTTILSSQMEDGKNRNILAEGGIKSGLFFEIKSSRLFWIQDNGIVSIKEDGSDIKHHKAASESNQLIIFKSYFVWISGNRTIDTFPMTDDHSIKTTIILPDNDTITGIAVFDKTSQPIEKGACDINNGGCDHICIVVIDGRVCRCQFGFTLDSNGNTCVSVPLNRDFLLAADLTHSRIYQVALQSGSIRTLDIPLVAIPTAVRYDSASKYLYWADAYGNIKRARKDGKDLSVVYSSAFGTYPERIELDPSSGYLYFITTDSKSSDKGYIGVIDTRNMYNKTLLTGLRIALGFALYPSKGIFFFTDFEGNVSNIYRSPIDGSLKTRIYTTASGLYDLTIDYNADRLYWSEYNELWSSDLSGSNREKLVTTKLTIRCVLSAYPYIYYHSDEHPKIIKLDVTKKQPITWMLSKPEMGFVRSLDIYPKNAMPGNSLCGKRNGICSTFCLPKEKSITCGCKDGVLLLSDGKTCDGVTTCPEQLQYGSLEATCQRFPWETCSFDCESHYIAKVQPQTVTCQENGTWNHALSDLCSAETLATDTPTTNIEVIAGGAVASFVAIAIVAVGIVVLLCRKKSGSATRDARQAHVYFSSQSGNHPRINDQSPSSYSAKPQLHLERQTTTNSYGHIPGNAISVKIQEHFYEEVYASAVENSTYPQNLGSTKENTYVEVVNADDYMVPLSRKSHPN